MVSVNQKVWKILASDVCVQKDMARKLINVRALAKYMIEKYKLQASLDSVINSIRRYDNKKYFEADESMMKEVFTDSVISTKNNIVCISMDIKAVGNLQRVLNLKEEDKNLHFQLITASKLLKIIMDQTHIEKILPLLPKNALKNVEDNLSEISVMLNCKALQTRGVLARIANEIALENINIVELITCPPEFLLYVNQEDILKTHEVIFRLHN